MTVDERPVLRVPPYVGDGRKTERVALSPLGERVSLVVRREVGRMRRDALLRMVEGAPYEERLDPELVAQLVMAELMW